MRGIGKIWMILVLALFFASCFNEDDYQRNDATGLVTLTIDTTKVLAANGSASGLVVVILDNQAAKSKRTVKLKTDLGSFLGGKGDSIVVDVDENFKAEAKLVSTKSGKATVTAIVENLKKQAEGKIKFEQAWPDAVIVSVDSFSVANSYKSEVIITAKLSSGKGVSTSDQVVSFSVVNSGGQPIGAFLNGINTAKSDAAGKATIRYSAGNSGQTGRLNIIAETKTQDNSSITGTTYIYLTP